MMHQSTKENILHYMKLCRKLKFPYKIKCNHKKVYFESDLGSYTNRDSGFPVRELNFIKQVKNTIKKEKLYKKVRNCWRKEKSRLKIKYYKYNFKTFKKKIFEQVWEIDFSSAYWEEANLFGIIRPDLYAKTTPMTWEKALKDKIISRSVYEQCVNISPFRAFDERLITMAQAKAIGGISKPSRLAAIGTLAKKSLEIEFDGEKEICMPDSKEKATEHLWHAICHGIGQKMDACAKIAGNDFLFFWVDALFVIGDKHNKEIEEFINKCGHKCTISKLEWVKLDGENHILVKGNGKYVKNDKTGKYEFKDLRRFPFTRVKRTFDDIEDKSLKLLQQYQSAD